MNKAVILVVLFIIAVKSNCQKSHLDTTELNNLARAIDLSQESDSNIKDYIVAIRGHTDYDEKIHFTLDTSTNTLLKCGYYEYYYETSTDTTLYKTIYYFSNGNFRLVKILSDSSHVEKHINTIYFQYENNNIINIESIISDSKWTVARVQSNITELLLVYKKLIEILEKRKNGS